MLAHSQGDFDKAIDRYQQYLELSREIGDRRNEAWAHTPAEIVLGRLLCP
jgi:hypothetical protein